MPSKWLSQDFYFPSKRDWWLIGLIWVGVLVSVVGGIVPLVLTGASWRELVIMASLVMGMDSLMLWVLYGTGYTVSANRLLIRCGPFSFRIRLETIESISPTKSPWSSPACSLDRLKIIYGPSRQSLMISPKYKPEFLSAIVQNSPSLIAQHNQVWKKEVSPSSSFDSANQPQTMV